MSSAPRVSAFAKRRRLNVGIAATVTDAIEPVTKLTTYASFKNLKTKNQSVKKDAHDEAVEQQNSSDSSTTPNENTFEPLVDAKVVTFSGIREIEQVNDVALKIRLSKGQKCTIFGIARLWIRQGSVSLYGANLHESPQGHTVFASSTDGLPGIFAQSKIAEFQLESVPLSDPTFPSALNVPGKLSSEARSSQMSFRILQAEEESAEGPADNQVDAMFERIRHVPMKATNSSNAFSLPTENGNTQQRREAQPRIVVVGKRASTTSKTCIALINRVLTGAFPGQGKSQVVFLDLDHISPTFACPGTISLALVQTPILGPPYTSPLRVDPDARNKLLCSYFMGTIDACNPIPYGRSCLEKLLSKDIEDVPLIIRIGSGFSTLSNEQIIDFNTITAPSLTVCISSSKASEQYEAAKTIAERSGSQLLQLVPPVVASRSGIDAHRISLQSHFRLCNVTGSESQWLPKTSALNPLRSLCLPLGHSAYGLKFLAIYGGILRNEDIAETLHKALVTIVASCGEEGTEPAANSLRKNSDPVRPAMDSPTSSFAIKLRHYENDLNSFSSFRYIGLAYVESLDEARNLITLMTTVDKAQMQRYFGADCELGLVLEKPSADGRFAPQLLFE